MKLVSVAEMQQIEKEADASGLTYDQMMENAGLGLAETILSSYRYFPRQNVLGLVGPGNNGGDTLVALAHMAKEGWQVTAYMVRPRPKNDPLVHRVRDAGGKVVSAETDDPQSSYPQLKEMLADQSMLIDGVLGTGTRLPLKPELAQVLSTVKTALAEMELPIPVVAVDCPSGVDLDNGEAAPEALAAELTVTMAGVKAGMLKFPAYNLVGELEVVGIGPLEELPTWQNIKREVADDAFVREVLPKRPLDAHKGTFGTALIVAGSMNYTGAALLAGEAAYRAGAGLVTLAVPAPLHLALAGHFPEATWLLLPNDMGVIAKAASDVVRKNIERVTALLVGPGLGLEDTTRDFLAGLLGTFKTNHPGRMGFMQGAGSEQASEKMGLPPMIVDADGLKLLAKIADWPKHLPAMTVLTPHPGEMEILTGLSIEDIQADRTGVAERFAAEWGHVVVLKGAFTVVAAPDGRSMVIPVATPALARAGTGDVLAGLITGLRAQGLDPYEAAVAGAWIHAQAGLRAVETVGSATSVLAGDVLFEIAGVIASL